MRPVWIAALALLSGTANLAQAPITATPLPAPSERPASATGMPPAAVQNQGIPGQAPSPFAPAPRPQSASTWVPQKTAMLQALDKVNARHVVLAVQPGQTVQFETLTIAVRSCVARPPDQAPDAAAFLTVTDSREGWGGFSGWMLKSSPAASMLEHAIYDVRVAGCEN